MAGASLSGLSERGKVDVNSRGFGSVDSELPGNTDARRRILRTLTVLVHAQSVGSVRRTLADFRLIRFSRARRLLTRGWVQTLLG